MSKKLERFCAQITPAHYASTVESMYVPVFQGPVKPKAHSGEEIFLIFDFYEIQSNTSSATCFTHLWNLFFFGVAQIIPSMLNLFHKQVFLTMVTRLGF